MLQKTELTEWTNASWSVDRAEHLGPVLVGEVVHLLAVLLAVAGVVEDRVGRELLRLEGRGRGHDLERRARAGRDPAVARLTSGAAGVQSALMRPIAE